MKKLYAWLCLRWRMVIQPSVSRGAVALRPVKKLWFDLLLAIAIVLLTLLHFKYDLNNDLQVTLNKMLQVNIGLIHGWIAGQIFIGKVDWEDESKFTPKNVGRIALWFGIVWAYAVGG
jgi:hypothetical protein